MQPIEIALVGMTLTNFMMLTSVMTLQQRIRRYESWVNRER